MPRVQSFYCTSPPWLGRWRFMPLPEHEGSQTIKLRASVSFLLSIPGIFSSMKSFHMDVTIYCVPCAFPTLFCKTFALLGSLSNAYTLSLISASYNVLLPGLAVASIPTILNCLFLFLNFLKSRSNLIAFARISTGMQLDKSYRMNLLCLTISCYAIGLG